MSNSDQQAPNNSTNQNQPAPPPYGNSVPPSSNPPNNSNPPNSNNNQGNANPWGQMMPPYGYPYPFPNQPQAPTSGENSNNQQQQNQAPPFPYPPYPYPPYGFPYPPNQGGQQPNSNTNQQFPYPYPPFGYPPYPFPYPPQQNNSGDSKQQQPQFPYPPYGYPPYPYPYPPQQQPPQQQPPQQPPQPQAQQQQQKQQPQRQNNQQQQQPQYSPFDWERRGLPSFDSKSNNNNSNNQQSQFDHTPFDWETGNNEPQKKIEIDWNYKSEYDVPDVPPDVERNTSVSAECKSRAFDPSTLPALDDSFYKLFPSEIASQAKANSQRRNFHARNKSSAKETFRIRFQFSQEEISDLSVSATFHIKEHTHKLYDFLNEVVFNEGTKFVIRTSVPAKAIGNNHNQQLRDVKITGNTILFVKISVFTGLKDDVNQQYTLQKTAIAEKLKQLEEEKKSQTPQ